MRSVVCAGNAEDGIDTLLSNPILVLSHRLVEASGDIFQTSTAVEIFNWISFTCALLVFENVVPLAPSAFNYH